VLSALEEAEAALGAEAAAPAAAADHGAVLFGQMYVARWSRVSSSAIRMQCTMPPLTGS
jgi:hypothetical protein